MTAGTGKAGLERRIASTTRTGSSRVARRARREGWARRLVVLAKRNCNGRGGEFPRERFPHERTLGGHGTGRLGADAADSSTRADCSSTPADCPSGALCGRVHGVWAGWPWWWWPCGDGGGGGGEGGGKGSSSGREISGRGRSDCRILCPWRASARMSAAISPNQRPRAAPCTRAAAPQPKQNKCWLCDELYVWMHVWVHVVSSRWAVG